MLESTETTPIPPTESTGNIWSSFPEYIAKLSLHKFAISATCDIFPLASFIATILSNFESSKHVLGNMLTPVLEGTLYNIIGIFISLDIAL